MVRYSEARTGCSGALGKFSVGRSGFGAARPNAQSWAGFKNMNAVGILKSGGACQERKSRINSGKSLQTDAVNVPK